MVGIALRSDRHGSVLMPDPEEDALDWRNDPEQTERKRRAVAPEEPRTGLAGGQARWRLFAEILGPAIVAPLIDKEGILANLDVPAADGTGPFKASPPRPSDDAWLACFRSDWTAAELEHIIRTVRDPGPDGAEIARTLADRQR